MLNYAEQALLDEKVIPASRVIDGVEVERFKISFNDWFVYGVDESIYVGFPDEVVAHIDKCMKTQPKRNRELWRSFKKNFRIWLDAQRENTPDTSNATDWNTFDRKLGLQNK